MAKTTWLEIVEALKKLGFEEKGRLHMGVERGHLQVFYDSSNYNGSIQLAAGFRCSLLSVESVPSIDMLPYALKAWEAEARRRVEVEFAKSFPPEGGC